jgi:hypothetical protein
MTLYSSIFPSFTWVLEPRPAEGLYPLSEAVTVQVTIASPIDAGASMRISGRTLDAPGEGATIGTFDPAPESHVHPEWRLILPNGVTGEYSISFTFSTAAPGYGSSPAYTLVLTNVEQQTTPTPTPTPTATTGLEATPTASSTIASTPTSTPTPASTATPTATADEPPTSRPTGTASATATPTLRLPICAGDCNGDGAVSVDELVRIVALANGNGVEACEAADGDGDGVIAIDEVVWAVRSALEGCGDS